MHTPSITKTLSRRQPLPVFYGNIVKVHNNEDSLPVPSPSLAVSSQPVRLQVRDMEGGEGRVYLNGELLVQESVSFPPDPNPRNVIMGQDEFKVKQGSGRGGCEGGEQSVKERGRGVAVRVRE